mmetsp:Transcript_24959/g.78671  ORF Transcript_24959/g.78671 Transcript_24959/m.78671 type:complete len:248 (+) Transcript_24959:278-1021(+)
MKYGVPPLGPPAPASGCASMRVRVSTPSSSESHTSKPAFRSVERGLSVSSSTGGIGTVLLTHSRARLTSSTRSASASSASSASPAASTAAGGAPAEPSACHLRNCEGDVGAARAKASSVGVCVSSGGRLGGCRSRLLEGLRWCQEFWRLVEAAGAPRCCACPAPVGGASASRGPRLAARAAAGSGSPTPRCRKGSCRRPWAEGRTAGSTVRHSLRKSTKSLEKGLGSLRPAGGLVLMTNIARVGGMW